MVKKILPLLLLVGLAVPAAADQNVPPYRASANLELVAHIPGVGGSDLEMFTRELRTWKDWYGNIHEVDEEDPPVTRHFAMVGNRSAPTANGAGPVTGGAKIIDITDPEIPFIAGAVKDCWADQGDIQIAPGGMLAGIAKQGGTCRFPGGANVANGSILVDISNVYDPVIVSVASAPRGAHNNTFSPDGKYVYISESGDNPGQIPIHDISDPANPRLVKNYALADGNSPHDIRFSADGKRAYGAGINRMRIFNTEDPENPVQISSIQVPGSTIGHDVLVTPDKSFLFFGEETQGGGTAPCPGGGVYVYDIRGAKEAAPELIGYSLIGNGPVTGRRYDEAFAGSVGGCTSHVMDMNPNQKSFTIGWYVSGLATFDFSSLYNPDGTPKESPKGAYFGPRGVGEGLVETGYMIPQGANTWAAKQYAGVPGYIFADDIALGFYVVKIKA